MINIHFIAIGGSVMHQLAIALHKKGYRVTGSDDEIFEPALSALKTYQLLPEQLGWNPENIPHNTEAVILGMHAKDDNPELLEARKRNLPIYSFPEYIYEESKSKTRIVVGGSHGKTTVTSMIMHVFRHSDQAFDYMVGARLAGFDESVSITDAPVIICEGDEYPASALEKRPKFHFLFPHIAILTGIAWDHINVFPTFPFYLEQFVIFINKIQPGGTLIYNATDEVLQTLVTQHKRDDIHYLPYQLPQHTIHDGVTTLLIQGKKATLQVFGNHNLLNLQAAFLACLTYGISPDTFLEAISSFKGAAKRLEVMHSSEYTNIFRDFAHAPSKVMASMQAVKHQYPDRKLFAVVELHTYSSLNKDFLSEYAGALTDADEAVVFYSNHALQLKRLPELNKEDIREGFAQNNLNVYSSKDELWQWLSHLDLTNANLLLMSSGNFEGLPVQELGLQKSIH